MPAEAHEILMSRVWEPVGSFRHSTRLICVDEPRPRAISLGKRGRKCVESCSHKEDARSELRHTAMHPSSSSACLVIFFANVAA